jgi:hypothetical protein
MGGIALFTLLLDNLCLCSSHVLRTRQMTPGNGVPFEGDFAFFHRNLLCIHPRNHLSSMGATKKKQGNSPASPEPHGDVVPRALQAPHKGCQTREHTHRRACAQHRTKRTKEEEEEAEAADAAEAAEAAAGACRKSRPRCRQQQRWRQEILMALPGPPRPPRRVRAPHLRTNYHSPAQKRLATHFAEVALAHNKNARRVPLPENVRCDPFLAVLTRRRRFWGGMGLK